MSSNALPRSRFVFRRYSAYGVSIRSDILLPLALEPTGGLFELQIRERSSEIRRSIRNKIDLRHNPLSAFDVGCVSDGSNYVGLGEVGECLVSRDGRRIDCYRFPQANPESFNVYVLGQALSFALVKNGIEPLHATAVVVEGRAVAFLGDCGFGKSTLAAEFLQAGHRLLTDDLLVLRNDAKQVLAYPGPPRIKLFPEMARRFSVQPGNGVRMNPGTQKLIIPLHHSKTCLDAVPLRAVYALTSPDEKGGPGVRITSPSKREAFVALLGGAFNYLVDDPARLRRQFEATHALANTTIVKRLSYPRSIDCLSLVRQSILQDLSAHFGIDPCKE